MLLVVDRVGSRQALQEAARADAPGDDPRRQPRVDARIDLGAGMLRTEVDRPMAARQRPAGRSIRRKIGQVAQYRGSWWCAARHGRGSVDVMALTLDPPQPGPARSPDDRPSALPRADRGPMVAPSMTYALDILLLLM